MILQRPAQFPRPAAGRIYEVTGPGRCSYILDQLPDRIFGPAPYQQLTRTIELPDALGDITVELPDPDSLPGSPCVVIHVTDSPDGAYVIPFPQQQEQEEE